LLFGAGFSVFLLFFFMPVSFLHFQCVPIGKLTLSRETGLLIPSQLNHTVTEPRPSASGLLAPK
jgi:hypothetical protein